MNSKFLTLLALSLLFLLVVTDLSNSQEDRENLVFVDNGGQLVESAGNMPNWPKEGWDGAIDGDLETWNGTVTVFNQPQEGDEHPWAVFAFKDEKGKLIDTVGFFMLTKVVIDESLQTRCAKEFRLQVSTEETEEDDFETVLEDSIDIDIQVPFEEQEWQEFTLSPVEAKYVKLILLSNYGDGTYTSLGEFEVYSAPAPTSVSSSGKLSFLWAKLKTE